MLSRCLGAILGARIPRARFCQGFGLMGALPSFGGSLRVWGAARGLGVRLLSVKKAGDWFSMLRDRVSFLVDGGGMSSSFFSSASSLEPPSFMAPLLSADGPLVTGTLGVWGAPPKTFDCLEAGGLLYPVGFIAIFTVDILLTLGVSLFGVSSSSLQMLEPFTCSILRSLSSFSFYN